jgi:hypothetical protein
MIFPYSQDVKIIITNFVWHILFCTKHTSNNITQENKPVCFYRHVCFIFKDLVNTCIPFVHATTHYCKNRTTVSYLYIGIYVLLIVIR